MPSLVVQPREYIALREPKEMSCYWLIAKKKPIAMAALPKCGSSSLRAHPGFVDYRPAKDGIINIPVRVAWIRQPILRIHSAWRGFHLRNGVENWRWGLAEPELAEWEAFVDHTFEHSNMHWNPQVPMLYHEDTFLPTVVERFENLSTRFNTYIDGDLGHENKGADITVDLNYRISELMDKYAEDMYLWEVSK